MPRPADAMQALSLASIVDKPTEVPPGLLIGLVADFGSIEAWQEAFALEARRKSGSDGWMVLGFSLREGRLLNRWQAADAAELSIEQTTPLLAYQREGPHGSHDQRLDHFIEHVDWGNVARLYQQTVYSASDPFAISPASLGDALLHDVRRRGAFDASNEIIRGATWRDPTTVDAWADELTRTRTVVYCVAGHEVSRKTAVRLRALNIDAYFLQGGIEGWKANQLPVTTKS